MNNGPEEKEQSFVSPIVMSLGTQIYGAVSPNGYFLGNAIHSSQRFARKCIDQYNARTPIKKRIKYRLANYKLTEIKKESEDVSIVKK